MGEARRRKIHEAAVAISKAATDKGLLIEAGFLAMLATTYPDGMSDAQRHHMRMAFFGGAQHLFGTLMNVLDPGDEPTDADLSKMAKIQSELDAFIQQYKREHGLDDDIVPTETGTKN